MSEGLKTSEEIWLLLGEQLKSFFVVRVRDHQTAEDLLQETFVRIHAKLDTVADVQRIRPWIFQIARNLLADHYRAKSKEAARLAELVEAAPDHEQQLEDVVIGWLPRMLELLPDKYREAVELYKLQGMSQQEIADRLNISLSGVKSRVQRGRSKLKDVLYDCCSFEHDRRGDLISISRNEDSAGNFDGKFEE
ncbi:RNA polymerase sigma factor SigZ [Mariniblastus fucicola]|uniref:RNA polymerase sigma factor SigZ n=1 Tax=Mariniblastus fucicola TaxID=980251 RepID=A0A5B9PCW7_9BACT|nr:RNA polymerase sigma factor SigZ [Mariniblastus fucicola]QEG23005.1 RNA polymerase sigma factor SigM [Mariniblastus fucicola]